MSLQLTKQQLQALGMSEMAPAKRANVFEKIGHIVFDNAILLLLESLTDEQIYSLNHALDGFESYEEIYAFLDHTYPEFSQYIEKGREKFVTDMMEQMYTSG